LIDGTLDVAIVLEPAQLDILQVIEVARIEFICVSSHAGLDIDQALAFGYVYVDWGLSHALEHRRAYPDAEEAMTRLSHAKMALSYIQAIGGSAYLPKRMVVAQLESEALHTVEGAVVFERPAYAAYPVRSPRLDLITETLELISATQ
jgi:DNA-binding transcriptional LysR family regulator